MTLRTLNYGNYGIFLIMGNAGKGTLFLIMGHAGFCPSAVALHTPDALVALFGPWCLAL